MRDAVLSNLHTQALYYARLGWFVFPCEPGGKAPITHLVRNGKDNATTDSTVINNWWGAYPDANIGIACEPSGLVILDVDVAKTDDGGFKQGLRSLNEIRDQLTPTSIAATGRGGEHWYYKQDEGERLQSVGFKEGLDLIGKGYVIAAPSVLKDGGAYVWKYDCNIPVLPPLLRTLAKQKKTHTVKEANDRAPITAGGRNNALFRLAAAIRDTGLGATALANAIQRENEERCVPPLPESEIAQLVQGVISRTTPTRDVLAGAVIEQEIHMALANEPVASWIEEIAQKEVPPLRFEPTGFDDLDILMGGGLPSAQVTGVIGSPSCGKSSLMTSFIAGLAKSGRPILHCSTELPREQVFARHGAHRLNKPWVEAMKGKLDRKEMVRALKTENIKIIGSDTLDRVDPIGMLRREAHQIITSHAQAPVIIVDYVQLLARGGDNEVRQRVGELTMNLRILSQELDTAVLAVFSTSRAFYGTDKLDKMREANDPTAYLAAAKESGDIEFDCATLLFLDVDKLAPGQPKPARIAVTRSRVGDIGFAGALAALDVGKFWGDKNAAESFGGTTPGQKLDRASNSPTRDQLVMLDVATRIGHRSWAEVIAASNMSSKRANAARAALLGFGKLEMVNETQYDSFGRASKRSILRVPGTKGGSVDVSLDENANSEREGDA